MRALICGGHYNRELDDMSQIARLLLSMAFVGLGLRLSFLGSAPARRRGQTLLILYVLGLSLAVGLSQKDAWPFSPYPVLAEDATRSSTLERVVLVGVDGAGREWAVEPMAWSPLPSKKITDWMRTVYPRLGPAQQREAERFLFERAEAARRQALAGTWLGHRRLLGPLAAPSWLVHRPAPPAPEPFVALRGYRIRWQAREVLEDPHGVERELLFDTARN
jgi:hypothetical protein